MLDRKQDLHEKTAVADKAAAVSPFGGKRMEAEEAMAEKGHAAAENERKDAVAHERKDALSQLEALSKEQLIELVRVYAKNAVALDGVWFQAVEREEGMNAAMRFNNAAWERFPVSDARRLKAFLGLGEHPGLEGLAAALPLKFNSIANHYDLAWKDGALVYRVLDCRVQTARTRKGMPLHPCKETGEREFASFARTIDRRIRVSCESCHPDVTDGSCSCSWKFTVEQ